MKSLLLLVSLIIFTIIISSSIINAQGEDKLKKFQNELTAIRDRPRNATGWKILAQALHPGESFLAPEVSPYDKINKLYCLSKALELQPADSNNWVELGFALLDPRQRMFSGSTHILPASARNPTKKEVDAKTCFIKAIESDGRSSKAWLGLAKVLALEAKDGKLADPDNRIMFPDGENTFSRLECLTKALAFDSTSKTTGAQAWFELGMLLKQKQAAGQRFEISMSTSTQKDVIVNPKIAFKKSLRYDYQFGEAWLELANTILTPAVKKQIREETNEMNETARYAHIKNITGQDDIVLADAEIIAKLAEEEIEELPKEIFDARRMLIMALKFNSGLGHAWHLLAELKPNRIQLENEKKQRELEEAEEKRRQEEAKAVLDEDDDEDEDEEAKKLRQDNELRLKDFDKEDPFKFLLDEESKHKVAGDDVWKHTVQECLQGALEAVRATPRAPEAWLMLAEDLKMQEELTGNKDFHHVFISGAPMKYRQCLVAALVNDFEFEPAKFALCRDLKEERERRGEEPADVLISGKRFTLKNNCAL